MFIRAFWLLIALGTALAAAGLSGFRFNLTSSLPVGLYRVRSGAWPLARGAIVLYCLPPEMARFAHNRGYVPRGGRCPEGLTPIGKIVAALPGDTVAITAAGIAVNDELQPHSRPLIVDRRGNKLPKLIGETFVVRRGYAWLLAPSDRSFDSRYLGELTSANIVGRVQPCWTIRGSGPNPDTAR